MNNIDKFHLSLIFSENPIGALLLFFCSGFRCDQAPLINSLSAVYAFRKSQSNATNNSSIDPAPVKTPLIICNLNISSDAKTLAKPSNVKRSERKPPPFCMQHQNSSWRNGVAVHDTNMKTINDFIVQGKLMANHRRRARQRNHAHQHPSDIIVNCENDECDECISDIALNVFNNINTDLLLSLDRYEMDSFGRLPGDSRTPTPMPPLPCSPASAYREPQTTSTANLQFLAVPPGYRPLAMRTPSPNTRAVIRIDVVNRDDIERDLDYNVNRLKEKRGVRSDKM